MLGRPKLRPPRMPSGASISWHRRDCRAPSRHRAAFQTASRCSIRSSAPPPKWLRTPPQILACTAVWHPLPPPECRRCWRRGTGVCPKSIDDHFASRWARRACELSRGHSGGRMERSRSDLVPQPCCVGGWDRHSAIRKGAPRDSLVVVVVGGQVASLVVLDATFPGRWLLW